MSTDANGEAWQQLPNNTGTSSANQVGGRVQQCTTHVLGFAGVPPGVSLTSLVHQMTQTDL